MRRGTERRHTVGGGCRGEISSAGSYEGACRKARSGGIYSSVSIVVYIVGGGEGGGEEREPISPLSGRGDSARIGGGEGGRREGERATVRASATEMEGARKRRSMGAVAATATRPPSPSVSHPIVNSKAVPDPSPCVLVRESCFTRCFWLLYSARGC